MASYRIDTLIVAARKDIRLLRYFLSSMERFSRLGGQIHVVIWKNDLQLLNLIALPENVSIHYKDDIPNLCGDDFQNQMYIKLHADMFASTEFIWVADADYLLVAPLDGEDFFSANGRPYWYYREWSGDAPETRWRRGSELFVARTIPYLFMDQPPYLFIRSVLRSLRLKYSIKNILGQQGASEFLIYGAYAYESFRDAYDFIEISAGEDIGFIAKVNQRYPTYCELDENVSFETYPDAKCLVFWSHWLLAERKMREILIMAIGEAGRADSALDVVADDLPVLDSDDAQNIRNALQGCLFSDGWVRQRMHFRLQSDAGGILKICLKKLPTSSLTTVIGRTAICVGYELKISNAEWIGLPVVASLDQVVEISFSGGDVEPGSGRGLYAQLVGAEFIPVMGSFVPGGGY